MSENISQLIIPRPLKVEEKEGLCALTGVEAVTDNPADAALNGIKAEPDNPKLVAHLEFIRSRVPALPRLKPSRIEARPDSSLEDGAYRLELLDGRIRLHYSTDAGLHNGMGTLKQAFLLSDAGVVKSFVIEDKPRFRWRGVHFDTARHYFPVSYILRLLDVFSLYHINVFHWHFTDDQGWRVEIKSHPELCATSPDGWYTQDEVRQVVAKASSLGIEVVPEIECPGHASALLEAHSELGCAGGPYEREIRYGVFEDVLCVGNDDVYKLLDDIIGEIAELFPSKWLHIGGDESPTSRWEACPKCRAATGAAGLEPGHATQWLFTKKVVEIVRKHGKTPMAWDELANTLPDLPLDPDIPLMLWRGPDAAERILANGNPVIVCRCDDGAYLDYKAEDRPEEPGRLGLTTLRSSYEMRMEYENTGGGEILGGQGNLWTEGVLNPMMASYMFFPRVQALAENFWTSIDKKDYGDFLRRASFIPEVLAACGLPVGYKIPAE